MEGILMRRKSVKELQKRYGNRKDRDTIIAVLLKRVLTQDQIIEYLLSAISESTKDDMLGEIISHYGKGIDIE